MSKIVGRFFLKLTDSKNLIGEFSNYTSKRNYTEGAVLIPQKANDVLNSKDDKFIGKYFSTWYEEIEHESVLAVLEIKKKFENENIFSLTWWRIQNDTEADRAIAGDPSFRGEGILCDGILIGDYLSVPPP